MENNLVLFEGKNIRRTVHEGENWFSIVDVIEVLTDTAAPSQYWGKIKSRDKQLLPIWLKLKLPAPDGKMRPTDCANTEGVLRIIQSVPSPKAEPFKLWLAGLGKQAIDETTDPELLTKRQAELYKAKGYSDEWINERLKTIDVRKELTGEWKKRGVEEGQEYGILTATIAQSTFGLTPSEHSQLKGLDGQNLRDHMNRMELILTAFSEEATRIITVKNDAQGFHENHDAAIQGGNIGKVARENFEKVSGEKVVSTENFLGLKTPELPDNALPNNTEEAQ
jgi:DNA-damage-inducible protein D